MQVRVQLHEAKLCVQTPERQSPTESIYDTSTTEGHGTDDDGQHWNDEK